MTIWKMAARAGLVAIGVLGCTPGYMKVEDLNKKEQGPQHCAARCKELGMEMGALVLVSNQLPGCVCLPEAGKAAPTREGAAAMTTGFGVILAAAAAARHQQQMQQQTQYSTPHR
jgi:hypothetical protein